MMMCCSCHKDTSERTIPGHIEVSVPGGVDVYTFADRNGYFYRRCDADTAEIFYIKGVNIGLTEPHSDTSVCETHYDTFIRWFGEIADMNANTVRAFTVMNPDFYKALHDYNIGHDKKLMLFQGIWFPESLTEAVCAGTESCESIYEHLGRASRETVDIIHGKSDYTAYGDENPAIYDSDVSEYLLGYILGMEYPPQLVKTVNNTPIKHTNSGRYITCTENARNFEILMSRAGNALAAYESQNYSFQAPVSFLNWQTLDTLTHPNEPYEEEDSVSFDTESIICKDDFSAGLFASVDVYPYYPEFMNHQREYAEFSDENGENDNYRAYLAELHSRYTVPLLIAEYGLSTSRGVAHDGICGYRQGGMDEEEQGLMCARMTVDIARSGCCGGLIFCWQDEWFKRTWNVENYTPDDPTQRTRNLSSAEQSYGLLAFDVSECYPDGELSEWDNAEEAADTGISVKYDAEYMHLLIELPYGFDFDKDTLFVPISVSDRGSNFCSEYDISFSEQTDYLLVMNGEKDTRVLCDAYCDVFMYRYGILRGVFGENGKVLSSSNSGIYNRINIYTANEMYLPIDDVTLAPTYREDGLLRYGDANPKHDNYDSLADFCRCGNSVEIRLPLYLIGIMNPCSAVRIGDLDGDDIQFAPLERICVGCGTDGYIRMYDAGYRPLSKIGYTERLKRSYYIMKDAFADCMTEAGIQD